jgi:hypothetical protein
MPPAYHCSVRAFVPLPPDDFEHPYPRLPAPFVPGKGETKACEVPGCFVCTGRLLEEARARSLEP